MTLAPAVWLVLSIAASVLCLLGMARDRRAGAGRPAALTAWRKAAVAAAMIAACTAAAADPFTEVAASDPATLAGADVVVLLDVSMSMLATDVAPSRLAAARAQLAGLFEADQTPRRIALVAFAADARLACPLTPDRRAFLDAMSAITQDAAAAGGSNLTAALDRALALTTAQKRRAAIIVVTDGEAGPEPGPDQTLDASRRLAAAGVDITIIGVGSIEGADVPVRGALHTAAVEDDGSRHRSTLDEARLQALAAAAGGAYLRLAPDGSLRIPLPTDSRDASSAPALGATGWSTVALLVALIALAVDTALWWWRGSPEIWA